METEKKRAVVIKKRSNGDWRIINTYSSEPKTTSPLESDVVADKKITSPNGMNIKENCFSSKSKLFQERKRNSGSLQLMLRSDTSPLDVWNAFCTWRFESKYTSTEQKRWCEKHKENLKNYEVVFAYPAGGYKRIKTIYNETEKFLGIQFYEYEGFATFISAIITDFYEETSKLLFTIDKQLHKPDRNPRTKYKRPIFYKYINQFVTEDRTGDESFIGEKLSWEYLENHKPKLIQIIKEKFFERK